MNANAKALVGIVAGIALSLASAATLAATAVPSGRWSFVFTDQKGRPDRPIRVFTYRPKACDATCPRRAGTWAIPSPTSRRDCCSPSV